MKKSLLAIIFLPLLVFGQEIPKLTDEMAVRLSEKPLHCINQEYPNKTAHIINKEVPLSPKDLHPSFYGCFDWHSSVHGHWMLLRLLKQNPVFRWQKTLKTFSTIHFKKKILQTEADYFTKYQLTGTFERTYGWAWLLKLDEELATWDHPKAKIWHENLKPLTDKDFNFMEDFLPKQTYPNRTGVHPNTAFAMVFALDWARATGDKDFENQLIEKAKYFYLNNTKTPAYLEPDGSDFFSPSLEIADLMRRVLPKKNLSCG
jgi:hypothetical protein